MFDKENPDFRLTMDNKIYGTRTNFNWDQTSPEIKIFDTNEYVLEIKLSTNYPLWLANTLSRLKIYHRSFSKYGEEYKKYINERRSISC